MARRRDDGPNWRVWVLGMMVFAWVHLPAIEGVELINDRPSAKLFREFHKWARRALLLQALGMLRIWGGIILARLPKFGDSDVQTILGYVFPEPTWSAAITWFGLFGTAASLFAIYTHFYPVLLEELESLGERPSVTR